ncbi:hypothetical protein MNB_SV-15-932 [hydrothermal vent metagenome]|uniref:Lcl C-terminal domain-containing protein n=1 Tax=hydrothermal vent metagenome TaxID=652676 RepID=A0A1W1EKN0_9ZZZZ
MKKIILIITILGSSLFSDFYKESSIVTDIQKAFQWQDVEYSQSEVDGYINGNSIDKVESFENAITYCEDLILDGYDDWRLPNFNELYTLVDRNISNPSLSSSFEYAPIGNYWSSTTVESNSDKGWIIDFEYGNSGWLDKSSNAYVRCIRN